MQRFGYVILALTFLGMSFSACAISESEQASKKLQEMQAEDFFSSAIQVRLAEAVARGDSESMQEAIRQGANVNQIGKQGMTPLFWALAKQSLKAVSFLLEQGADPNIKAQVHSGANGETSAMDIAALLEDSSYLEALLKHEGNPNTAVGISGRTVIYQAALHRRLNNIALLLKHGADIDHQNISGSTVLMDAVSGNSYQVALFLLRAGADPKIKDRWGRDAAHIITKYGAKGIVQNTDQYRAYLKFAEELNRSL